MADLRSDTTIGGKLVWSASNLPLITKQDTLEYRGFKLYSEHDKPTPNDVGTLSTLQINTGLDKKVDKITGKSLSDKNFTAAYETKLTNIATGAQVNVATNLTISSLASTLTINSSTGNSIVVPEVTTSKAGVLSNTDKVKLNSLPSGVSGIIPITGGGTGSNNIITARNNLGLNINSTHGYGVLANTVAQGNDSRILNGQTAFSWGNHKSEGYIKTFIDTKYSAGTGLTLSGTRFDINFGTGTNQSLTNGSLGLGTIQQRLANLDDATGTQFNTYSTSINQPPIYEYGAVISLKQGWGANAFAQIAVSHSSEMAIRGGYDRDWTIVHTTSNQLSLGTTSASARTALQLGNTSTHNYGSTSNTIMQGNDARVLAAATKTELSNGMNLKANTNISMNAGRGLTGGGSLAATRTFDVTYGTGANTAAQGNDSRILNGQYAFTELTSVDLAKLRVFLNAIETDGGKNIVFKRDIYAKDVFIRGTEL